MELFGIDFGCSYESLNNGHLPDKDCLLPLLSKILAYCLIATSTTVKLPQILKIWRHKSIEGLSVVASELEVVGYTIGVAYCFHKGLPFSAFGEFVFILIQAIILLSILYYYSQPLGLKTWTKTFLYCVVAYIILAGQIDPVVFEALYASKHVIFLLARVPQIWKNFKNKSTGQLSSLTILMNLGGSTVRIFTSVQVKAPTTILLGSFIAITMNSALLSQFLIYKKPVVHKEKKIE